MCGISSLNQSSKFNQNDLKGQRKKKYKTIILQKHNILGNLLIETTLQYNKIGRREVCTRRKKRTRHVLREEVVIYRADANCAVQHGAVCAMRVARYS